MDRTPQLTNASRVIRLLHTALVAGLSLGGVALYLARAASPGLLASEGPTLSLALTAAAVGLGAIAIGVLRRRVPHRRPEQDADSYWSDAASRGPAIAFWAAIEGAGLVSAVGYFITGGSATVVAFALALVALLLYGPGRLEGN